MNENEIIETSVSELDDDWGDIDLSDIPELSEGGSDEVSDSGEQQPADQQPAAPEAVPTKSAAQTESAPKAAEPDGQPGITLKHFDETKTVSLEEAKVLAQKGMDYDRVKGKLSELTDIRTKYEELLAERAANAESVEFIKRMADAQKLTVAEFIDSVEAAQIARDKNVDISVAKGIAANQRRERELQAERSKLAESAAKQSAEEKAKEARKADFAAFVKAYPEVDPRLGIPAEVWAAVSNGEKLTDAYTKHLVKTQADEITKLKAEIESVKQLEQNRARTLGSQSSSGKSKYADDWERSWYEDD